MSESHPDVNGTVYLAHSQNAFGRCHPLREHLLSVRRLASERARETRWSAEAALAALLHDLGKYGDLFQGRLRGEQHGIDHWSAGAVAALECRAMAAALAVEGHHIGLQAAAPGELATRLKPVNLLANHWMRLRLSDVNHNRLKQRAGDDGLTIGRPEAVAINLEKQGSLGHAIAAMMDVRMLFSCLVDADFLDTEAHFQAGPEGKRYRQSGPALHAPEAIVALERFMAESVRAATSASADIARGVVQLPSASGHILHDNHAVCRWSVGSRSGVGW